MLVRLLFCLFADLIDLHTRGDGSDVGVALDTLFATLRRLCVPPRPSVGSAHGPARLQQRDAAPVAGAHAQIVLHDDLAGYEITPKRVPLSAVGAFGRDVDEFLRGDANDVNTTALDVAVVKGSLGLRAAP